jgi:hypothetical protein
MKILEIKELSVDFSGIVHKSNFFVKYKYWYNTPQKSFNTGINPVDDPSNIA